MNNTVNFALLMALGIATLNVTAAAQTPTPGSPRALYAVYEPSQSTAQFQQVDWDDHHRCDGDHDRDDRPCYSRDRDGDRYRDQYYYRGNGYVGNAPYYDQGGGWYDNHGHWQGDGWYDRNGRWHKGKRHGDRDDR